MTKILARVRKKNSRRARFQRWRYRIDLLGGPPLVGIFALDPKNLDLEQTVVVA